MSTVFASIGIGILLAGSIPVAGAAVVSNQNVSFQANQIWNGTAYVPTFQIGVAQTMGGSAFDTSTWFTVTSSTVNGSTYYGMYVVTYNTIVGSDWYLVSPNNTFVPDTAATQFSPLIVGGTFYSPKSIPNGVFYLAYNTGSLPAPTRGEAFGWLRVQNTDGTLNLLNSVSAYGEPGIVIGSTTVVPEPAMLASCATTVGLLLRRRRSSARHGVSTLKSRLPGSPDS